MKSMIGLLAFVVLAAGCGNGTGCKTPEAAAVESKYASPENMVLGADGASVFVTCATGAKVMNMALDGSASRAWKICSHCAEKEVPVNPTGIALGKGCVYVTAGVQCGELQKYGEDGSFRGAVEVGHSPFAPVVSADATKVWVLNRFLNRVVEVDASAMAVTRTVNVPREPFAATLAAEGKLLFVANLLPTAPSTSDVVSASISMICTKTFDVKNIALPNGSTGVRGITSSPDGKFVYVAHTMGRFQLPTTQLERGWMNTAALTVLDGNTGMWVNTILLDDSDRGACNPWGVAVSQDGKWLCVNHAGSDELSIIDRTAMHVRLTDALKGRSASGIVKSASDVYNDLAFLTSIRRRVKMPGFGPRGLILAGTTAVSALYFSDALVLTSVASAAASKVLRVGPEPDLAHDRVRRGEMLYNSGTMCFQQWQSCATCHPDGRIDGLNWDLLNDGVGNPKQTKSQLYGQFTPPTMATGIRKDMKACNRAGLIHIQFVQRPEEDALCLDAYTESIRPVPSPYLVKGRLSEAAVRGKAVYEKSQCTLCHGDQTKTPDGDSLYSDCKLYDVGLGTNTEKGRKFDTPTLCEVWRTAPYLYDGRAATMKDVLTRDNANDTHGVTQGLSAQEIDDLTAYVLSL